MSHSSETKSRPVEGIVTSDAGYQAGWRGRLKWLAPLAVIVAILVVGGLWWWLGQGDQTKPTVAAACSSQLISQGSKAIAGKDFATAGKVINQIGQQADASNDPNCVYLGASYAIMTGNAQQATQNYNRLVELKQANGGTLNYSSAFSEPPLSLANLKATIAVVKTNASANADMNRNLNSDLSAMDKLDPNKDHKQ